MAVVRKYHCDECGTEFEKLHHNRDEPPPPCPGCEALEAKQVPAGFSIGGGTHSKALDITQRIVEEDFGMTNMRDNLRPGDIAAPPLPAHLQKQVQQTWGQAGGLIAAARAGTQAANAVGSNPMMMLQRSAKRRGGPVHRVPVSPVNKVR